MQGLWASPQDIDGFAEAVRNMWPGGQTSGLRLLGEGFGSVALESNDGLVILIAKNEMGAAARRLTVALVPALSESLTIGLPIPVWHMDVAPGLDHGAYAYKKVAGRPLSFEEMREAPKSLIADLASFMRALHRFPVERALQLGAPDVFEFRGDIESMQGEIDDTLKERLEPLEYERVLSWWDTYLGDESLLSVPPALVHGDLWPDNLLVNDDATRLLGVIDFGDAALLDAAYDFVPIAENSSSYAPYRDAYVAAGGIIDTGFERRLQRYWELRSASFFSLRASIRADDEGEMQDSLRKLRASPLLSKRQLA